MEKMLYIYNLMSANWTNLQLHRIYHNVLKYTDYTYITKHNQIS